MQFLDLTLASGAENLALDEALLDLAETSGRPRECLRVWESPTPMVVLGRSSPWADEARVEACRARNIPILRRSSGGAAIVAGPGCLMYALVFSYELRPHLRSLDLAHDLVLQTNLRGLSNVVSGGARRGTSDLAIGDLKFSGNSARCKRSHFLYHGTLLYDFDLALIAECLKMPARQPDYRRGREHRAFVMNLPASAGQLREALVGAWQAREAMVDWPRERVAQLVLDRYSQSSWNEQR